MTTLPTETALTRVMTRPDDANSKGDIFGGWLMSQLDIAGASLVIRRAEGPIATVAVKELQFMRPVFVHDVVSFFGEITAIGTTSLTVHLKAFAERFSTHYKQVDQVAAGIFIYVAIAKPGEKRLLA